MSIDVLGVMVKLGRSTGAEIAGEAPNGVAALAGLHPGDVINAVDGKTVRTPMELAAELANRPGGDKVRLGYLLRGEWQAERVVMLNATR
jgi:S1-C subfamily serine protease